MSKYITKGFTLVELIVVITILAILWTIAFIALQDFNKDARDSQRITDVKSFSKWIELYATESWEYPNPDSAVSVTDSWDEVVVKGLIWELASKNARISEDLKDPLTWENFEYSLTWNRANYEIKYYAETSLAGVFKNAYADKENMEVRIIWNYNKLFSVSRWWKFVAMPSLFPWNSSDSSIDLSTDSLDFEVEWVWTPVAFVPKEVDKSSPESVVSDLKSHYETETELQVIEEINKVSNIDTSDSQAVEEIYSEATGDTTDSSGGWSTPAPSCDASTKPADNGHITFVTGTPTSANQAYVQDAANCGYSCADGYTWINCETAPPSCDASTRPADNGHITYVTGTPTSVNQAYLQDAANCGYSCTDGYTWASCETAPALSWTDLDPNCDIPDITIGSQTWAGCNSTLWNGFEWGQTDADIGTSNYSWTVWACYDYDWNSTATCTPWDTTMASDTKANTWFSGANTNWDSEFNNIWWKLYTYAQSSSACHTWRHVPTDEEWTTLENTLYWSECRTWTW